MCTGTFLLLERRLKRLTTRTQDNLGTVMTRKNKHVRAGSKAPASSVLRKAQTRKQPVKRALKHSLKKIRPKADAIAE